MKLLVTRRKATIGALVALAATFSAILATGADATALPAWRITQIAAPSTFKPGSSAPAQPSAGEASPQYEVVFTNVGGGTENGEITVTDELPAGVSFSTNLPELNRHPCDAPVGQTVTCHSTQPQPPGEYNVLSVPVSISLQAIGPVENRVTVSGANTGVVTSVIKTPVSDDPPDFDLLPGQEGIGGTADAENGLADTQAGSHPFGVTLETNVTVKKREGVVSAQSIVPAEPLRSIGFNLPAGFVVNPQATPKLCTEAQLNSKNNGEGCPAESQVGNISINFGNLVGVGPGGLSLYNMQPPHGKAAELGFNLLGTLVHITGGVNGNFHLVARSTDILAKVGILGARVSLWGDPSDERHDHRRNGNGCSQCSVPPMEKPFLTMPTACHEPLPIGVSVSSWLGTEAEGSVLMEDLEGNPLETEGCNALSYAPEISSQATTNVADAPTGLTFAIRQAQNESITGLAPAALKDARVTLPEGMTVNAAAANGLSSCSEEQVGYQPSEGKVRFDIAPQSCPNAAKVGTLEVTTPLLGHKLPGSIYVAKPFDNPFGSLLALYLSIEDEESGVIVKLGGKVEPDPSTGQLTATFTENPQLPLEAIELQFFNGPAAALKTPLTCGTKTTTTTMTPWSTPEGVDTHPTGEFKTEVPAVAGACPSSEVEAPAAFNFTAGTASPLAGAYSPFVLRLVRRDGTQHIAGIDTTLPEGLVGKLAGVPYCPESAIALAKSREAPEQGKVEQASPSCPAASEVGTVQVTAGAGITPIPVGGHVYLAGPYKGAPLSFVVIVPAVAGPFDLGSVVNRVALNVGEYTSQIHAVSDPLPTIIQGIPLDVRSIDLKLTRPGFSLNPTSCEAKAIEGAVITQAGQAAPLNNRFQVGECGALAFKPKLKISLKGSTKRTGHPALKAVLSMPAGGANIAKAQVGLPHGEFLDNGHIGTVCTQPQLKAQTCPAGSIYGKAKAWTPLLDQPLEGPVYLGTGFGHKLPDLVADLNGQIRVLVHGRVDTDKRHGIRNTFEAVPDAPVSRFVLEMKGGKKGLLVNSENTCRKAQKAEVDFTAQNGKVQTFEAPIANGCKNGKGKKGHRKGGGKRGG